MRRKKPVIGLLGGSFNPAHQGHVFISKEAKKRLDLKEVWWLVATQNPLKSKKDMAGFEDRLFSAKEISAPYSFIKPSDFEKTHRLHYTLDVLRAIIKIYSKDYDFVFLMGADNYANLHLWKGWRELIGLMPIYVFSRQHARFTQNHKAAFYVRMTRKPVSTLLTPRIDLSATILREKGIYPKAKIL